MSALPVPESSIAPIIIAGRRPQRRPRPQPQRHFGRLLVRGVLVGGVLVTAVAMSAHACRPYGVARRQQARLRSLQHQIRAADAQERYLRQQIALMGTDQGVEIEARKLGMIRKGEIALSPQEKAP